MANVSGSMINDFIHDATDGLVPPAGSVNIALVTLYNDTMAGNNGNDSIYAGGGNDVLDGGLGADSMVGGIGNDVYFVGAAGDEVVEKPGGGIDSVKSTITYTLTSDVEKLILNGTAAINGTGNTLANTLTGNAAANSLVGLAGNDTLIGGNGNDTLNGGAGVDSLTGGANDDAYFVDNAADKAVEVAGGGTDRVNASVSYVLGVEVETLTLTGTAVINGTGNVANNAMTGNTAANSMNAGVGNDTLNGGAGNDTLNGGNGNDSLNGGTGVDSMVGGANNDLYVVDIAGDKLVELAGGGIDSVNASVIFTLAAEVENLTLTGTAVINGTGNGLSNKLTGNVAHNVMNGMAGDDTLVSGAGNDRLAGGTGNDTFVFNAASSGTMTTIDDFSGLNRVGVADVLDISGSGDALFYLGDAAFANDGQVQVRYAGSSTLQVDLDGDGQSDLAIVVQGMTASTDLTSTDFI